MLRHAPRCCMTFEVQRRSIDMQLYSAPSSSQWTCDRHLDQQQSGVMLSEQHTALYYGSTTGQTEWDC